MVKPKHRKKTLDNSSTAEELKLIEAEVRSMDRTYKVEFAPSTTADELLRALLKEMNLPERSPSGDYHYWKLLLRSGNLTTMLHGKEVMGELIGHEIVILYLQPEVCAG